MRPLDELGSGQPEAAAVVPRGGAAGDGGGPNDLPVGARRTAREPIQATGSVSGGGEGGGEARPPDLGDGSRPRQDDPAEIGDGNSSGGAIGADPDAVGGRDGAAELDTVGPGDPTSTGDAGSPALCQRDSDCTEGRCLEAGGGCVPCPGDMRLVRFADGTAFCIDRLEVTQERYQDFLDRVGQERPDIEDRPQCGLNPTLQPSDAEECFGAFDAELTPSLPVSCVDACDAVAYCRWAGKRLCGGKGGKIVPAAYWTLADYDEWQRACDGGTGRMYPYGSSFDPDSCNVASDAPVAAGSNGACSSEGGVLDLSGNVSEWTDYCGVMGGVPQCVTRGGSFLHHDPLGVGCFPNATDGVDPAMVSSIYERAPHIGFRCCVD